MMVCFLLQLIDLLAFHLPALPDHGQPGGDFVVIQPLLCYSQTVGRALRDLPFLQLHFAERFSPISDCASRTAQASRNRVVRS